MTKRIARSIILLSCFAALFSTVIVTVVVNRYFSKRIRDEMIAETTLIARGAEFGGINYFRKTDFKNMHVSWIAHDGSILYDSMDETESMADDPDFIAAIENGSSSSSDMSLNINRSLLNYSLRISDGTVVRISDVHISYVSQLERVVRILLVFFLASTAISMVTATIVSRWIVRPINEIDLDSPKVYDSFPELTPLLDKLRTQNRMVAKQMYELRESREQFSLITESMSEGLIVADQKLTVLACNSGALHLLGVKKSCVGSSIYALNNSEAFRKCVQNAAGGRHSEIVLSTDKGDREIIASPAKAAYTVNGIVVFIMDVTEKQQLETMRREFTSNVTHELKTPLTTIYGMSDLLANNMVKQPDVPQFGSSIRNEADRLMKLINDIVSLSKLDENSVPDETEDIDLFELSAEIMYRLAPTASKKNVSYNVTGEHVIFKGNRTILDEVITNLCDNAIKYNNEGGSYLVKIAHLPKSAIITVSDTGMGIPQQSIGRVFERFYRVDKSRSRKIKGTGLGLSIVKHGVMYHNGNVSCESDIGKGTVFTIELPL